MFRRKITIELKAHHQAALMGESHTMTPDLHRLEQYITQLLFVTDEWKRNGNNWHILQKEIGAELQCTAYTRHHYRFLVHTGFFHPTHKPLVLETPFRDGFKIEGELYSIPDPARSFQLLDRLKGNTLECVRKRVDILYPHRRQWTGENLVPPGTYVHGKNYGISWDGKFPYLHPLAGEKTFTSEEKVRIIPAHMYVALPGWWAKAFKHPEQYDEVPRYSSETPRRWLSEYYRYDKPK